MAHSLRKLATRRDAKLYFGQLSSFQPLAVLYFQVDACINPLVDELSSYKHAAQSTILLHYII